MKLAFSLGSIVFALGVLELGARLAGVGGDRLKFGGSLLPYQQVYPPLFEAVNDAKRPRFRSRDPRLVDRSFPATRPPERVFVLGESAVIALGFAENESFARALERDLRKAGSQATVVNCGIVALDSRQMLAIARDVCAHDKPDVIVLHVGNNECLEEHAIRFVKETEGLPFTVKLEDFFSSSHLFLALKQWGVERKTRHLTRATFRYDDLRHGESKVVEHEGVVLSPAEIDAAVAAHASRMRQIVELGKASGARVVLMTVATNLEWTAPGDSPEARLAKATSGERLESARARLDKEVDDASKKPLDHWHALFERACVKRALGDLPGALADFRRANDEDPHLRRTLTKMNENMRVLAQETGVMLVDGERILAAASKDGITGFDMLYDYVHFSPEGNERLGAALAKAILPSADPALLEKQVDERRALLASRPTDALEVEEYYGWNDDRSLIANKDLWKYDDAHERLCQDDPDPKKAPGKVQLGSATAEECVWAANYHALRVGDEARARELYAKAKQMKPELAPVIDANVRWLDGR
jgi:lysophospholipase L1-like esterase